MPTITNAEVGPAVTAIEMLIQKPLPVKGALRIRKVRKALIEHWKDLEDVRQSLLRQHAEIGDDGQVVTRRREGAEPEIAWLTPEDEAEANAAYQELMAEPFELSHGIEVEHLGNVEITPLLAVELGGVLIDPEDDDESAPGG